MSAAPLANAQAGAHRRLGDRVRPRHGAARQPVRQDRGRRGGGDCRLRHGTAGRATSTLRPGTDAASPNIVSARRSIAASATSSSSRPRSEGCCAGRSKPGPIKDQWIAGLDFETVYDYGYDGVMRSFEDSLQRLGIPSVDLLLVHDLDIWNHKNPARLDAYFAQLVTGGWRALTELRDSGAIKGIGAGLNTKAAIPRFLDLFDIDFFLLAMRYTLLEQDVLDDEFPRCAERGVGIVIGGGYNSGILATGAVPGAMYNYEPAGPAILERVAKIEAVCRRWNVPLAAAALQLPPRASDRRLDHSGRDHDEAGRAESRRLPPQGPRRSVGGAEARKIDSR